MTMDDPDHLASWLKRLQNVDLEVARLREPGATAQRLSGLANAADRALPFGTEPSGFILAQRRLSPRGDAT